MGGSYGRKMIYYIRENQYDRHKIKFVKRDALAHGFTVLTTVELYGKTPQKIINKGPYVNSDYCLNFVLKLCVNKDVPKLLNGHQNEMAFH